MASADFDPEGQLDILLTLPDKSLQVGWQFKKGTTWPAPGATRFSGNAVLLIVLSNEVMDLYPANAPETRRLLMAMRKAYDAGEATFASDAPPTMLNDREVRGVILSLLDAHLTQDIGDVKPLNINAGD